MQQTLKRLTLIQTSLELDDIDIVVMQVSKLQSLKPDVEVQNILQKLESLEYASALQSIEAYLAKYKGVVTYTDPEVQGLKLELKMLEQKLQNLDTLKDEQLNTIEEFNTQYSLSVGDLVEKILQRKEERLAQSVAQRQEAFEAEKALYEALKRKAKALEDQLEKSDGFDSGYDEVYEAWQKAKEEENTQRKKVKENKEELEEDETFQEYEELKEAYEEFHKEYEEVLNKERFELSDEEKKELKKLFRKAARLCHPDIVIIELRDKAHEITAQLNEAYAQKDLNRVKKILEMLENGDYFDIASDKLESVDKLKQKIAELRAKVVETTEELEAIKADETYCTIQDIEDWDVYFNALRDALEKEYQGLLAMQNPSKEQVQVEIDDAYWDSQF